MFTDDELDRMRWDLESDRVERKESVDPEFMDRIRQAVCAFANDLPGHDAPGVLFIGLRDDGRCAGLAVSDELLRTLAAVRGDGRIVPVPTMTVGKHRFEDGCEVMLVTVAPATQPPVRLDGRAWIRVGPTRAIASANDERLLSERRRAGDRPFDVQPVAGATLAHLDLDLFRTTYLPQAVAPDVLAANQRSLELQLAALRLIDGRDLTPTALGLLVLCPDPRDWIPGAYVQFVRFDGEALTDPIVSAPPPIAGQLPEVMRELDQLLSRNISTAVDVAGAATEVRYPDYPVVALRQLVYNAVLHRTYEGTNAPVRVSWFSDRVEILSPGGPFGVVTRENFGTGATDYRNPHLAEAMRVLGYVQRFGVGIALARKALADNSNPALDLQPSESHVLAVVRRRR